MKKILFILVNLLAAQAVFSAERLVDEDTLHSWGYRTVSIEENQFIKKITKINDTGPAVYPRFYLSKECYETSTDAHKAISDIESLQRTDIKHRDFDYRQGFVVNNCLYMISTNSLMFKQSYQPEVFKLFQAYITNK